MKKAASIETLPSLPKPKEKRFEEAHPVLITVIATIAVILCLFAAIKLISMSRASIADDSLTINVIDGDTLVYAGETIRLICVDTPEKGEKGYAEATNYLFSLIKENITIKKEGFDNYNRTLAWVYSDKKLVNKEIVDNGYGEIFEYDNTNCSRIY